VESFLRVVFALVIAVYVVVSVVATFEHGYVALFTETTRSWASAQVFLDLCVALFLVGGQMRADAQKRDVTVWPFLVALPFLGSVAALGWIAWRQFQPAQAPVAAARA